MVMIQPGALAPHFTLLGLDGREYSLPGDTIGRPLLLIFFRTSCPACDLTFPYLNRLQKEYPAGWRLWTVSQDELAKTTAYRDRMNVAGPVLLDAPRLDVSVLYDPLSTPTLFLVDPQGRVDFTLEGFDKIDLNEISRRIASSVGSTPVEIAPAGDGKPDSRPGGGVRQTVL